MNWREDPVALERWFAVLQRTIAIDFDGVLHPYTEGWVGSVPADEDPVPGAYAFCVGLHEQGYELIVFSCRADHHEGKAGIEQWLAQHGFDELIAAVTHLKPAAMAYIDDRAVPFLGTWDDVRDGIAALADAEPHGARPAPDDTPERKALEALVRNLDPETLHGRARLSYANAKNVLGHTLGQSGATAADIINATGA